MGIGVVAVAFAAALVVDAASAWAASSHTAYVANQAGSVTPIDTATNTAGTAIGVGSNPSEVAITPDGKTAYVTNGSANNVTPINVATNTKGTPIPVGGGPVAIAITPTGPPPMSLTSTAR